MCVDSICTPIDELPKSCNCNDRGVCNQKNECHCDDGWAPPRCVTPGRGGSVSSGRVPKEVDLALLACKYICLVVAQDIIFTGVDFCKLRSEFLNKLADSRKVLSAYLQCSN